MLLMMGDFDDLVEEAVYYLLNGFYPDGSTENQKRSIRRKSKKLQSKNGEIFYLKSKKDLAGQKVH